MTPEQWLLRVRALCARLPATGEKNSWGHPNFTAGGRIFAALGTYGGRPSLGIATSREEQAFLVEDPRFSIAPYTGKNGWIVAWLDREQEWPQLEDLLRHAHARVLAGNGARATSKRSRRRRPASPKAPAAARPRPKRAATPQKPARRSTAR